MRKNFFLAASVAALLIGAGATTANAGGTANGVASLGCIPSGDAPHVACTVKGGVATVTVVSDSGDPAGALVYTANNGVGNAAVSQINQLGFSYSGSLAPRLNIPVTSGAGGYVFVEGFSCNDGFGNVAVLTNPNCPVQYDGSVYNNWQQFVAQHPTVQVVANDVNQPYIIQDTTGSGTISNVKLGKSLTGKAAK